MSLFETTEPKLDCFEKAHLWKLLSLTSDATVTYDTRSGRMFDFFSILLFLLQIISNIYLEFN